MTGLAAVWPETEDESPFASVWTEAEAATAPKSAVPDTPPVDLTRYQQDPIAWMVERMKVPVHTLQWSHNPGYDRHVWDGDTDPFARAAEALARWDDVGIESATGTGKTYFGGLIVLWFCDVFRPTTDDGPGGIVVTAAPKEKQLTLHIWKEIGRLWPVFQSLNPEAELTSLRIRMRPNRDDWGAVGFAVGVGADEQSATKAQGFHAEHMLIVTEETPGIHAAVMTAFENTCTGPHNLRLALGNPDHQLDQLHLFCQSPGVVSLRISALDHPNVVSDDPSIVPGAASRKSTERRLQKYGDESPLYHSRVRGVSPTEAVDALIKLSWLKAAVAKSPQEKAQLRSKGPKALGVDVANSENGDRGSLAHGTGAVLERVDSYPCPDANAFARLRVAPLVGPTGVAGRYVGIDSVGVGAGSVNEMTRLKKPVVALNGGMSPQVDPTHEEEFANLRSQMYWTFAMELFHGEFAIEADDAELFADLTAPKWGTRNGKIVVESKEDLKKRLPGQRSPDKGDSAVYWNWVRKDRTPPRSPRLPSRVTYTG